MAASARPAPRHRGRESEGEPVEFRPLLIPELSLRVGLDGGRRMPRFLRNGAAVDGFRHLLCWFVAGAAVGAGAGEPRCLRIDVYTLSTDEAAGGLVAGLEAFAADRAGLKVVRRFVDTVPEDRESLLAAARQEGFAADGLPVVVACGAAVAGCRDPALVRERLGPVLRLEVYTRRGCARCAGRTAR